MKTFKKVLLAICISLAVCLGIAITVFYIVKPDLAKEWFATIVDYVNKPLPIVGVTTLAVLVFVWKLIVTTQYGKSKLAAYDNKVAKLEQEYEKYKAAAENEKQELKEQNEKLRAQLIHACELSTNQKIKNFGKELENYGEKATNSDTKEE